MRKIRPAGAGPTSDAPAATPATAAAANSPRDIAAMALRIAASGDVGGAMSYFTPAKFPQEKQEAAVREAYIELRLRRLVAMAAAGQCPAAIQGLGNLEAEDKTLPFTFSGFGSFTKGVRFQYWLGVVEFACVDESAARKRWERLAKANPEMHAANNHGKPAVAATAKPGEFKGEGVVAAKAASDGNGHVAGDDLTQLVGIGPKAAAALASAGITSYAALAEANEPQLRHALHEADMMPPGNVGTWPMQASYATKGDWQGLMRHNEKAMAKAKPAAAARTATAAAPPDDLTQINGIGPRIASILNDGGITTFAELQHANTGELRQIIAVGGALPPSSLDSWPTQASYASRGDWSGLASYNRR